MICAARWVSITPTHGRRTIWSQSRITGVDIAIDERFYGSIISTCRREIVSSPAAVSALTASFPSSVINFMRADTPARSRSNALVYPAYLQPGFQTLLAVPATYAGNRAIGRSDILFDGLILI